MRQIKFKAYHPNSKTWLKDFTLSSDGTEIYETGDRYNVEIGEVILVQLITTIKDKEVYQGDYDADGNMIDFCETCMGYQFHQIDIPTKDVIFCHNCEGNFMLQDHINEFEIIGNIHQP